MVAMAAGGFVIIGGFKHSNFGQVLVTQANAAGVNPIPGIVVELHHADGTFSRNMIKGVYPFNKGMLTNGVNPAIGLTFVGDPGTVPVLEFLEVACDGEPEEIQE